MTSKQVSIGQTMVLVLALVLIMVGLGLSTAGLLSPSWQVVDIKEFRAEHHHGLWLDCTRGDRYVVGTEHQPIPNDDRPLHCTYKFDYSQTEVIEQTQESGDRNSAAGEAMFHQFFGWQKAVLIFIFLSMAMGVLALCSGLCAPCFGVCGLILTILVFLSAFFGCVADGVFFFAAHRVDSRFVQGLVGTYEQLMGMGFVLHGLGSVALLLAFVVSVIAAYQFVRQSDDRRRSMPLRELAPLRHMRDY